MLAWFKMRRPGAESAIRGYGWSVAIFLLLLPATVACGRESERPVLPTAIITTSEPSSVPPTVTEAPPLAPTVTQAVAATITITITPSPTPAGCSFAYFFQPAPDSCPAGPPVTSAAAEQPFEDGVMLWLAETDSIIVFFPDGRWQSFEDTWSEGEPESDPALAPPEGRFQPIRGFGKLWRENPGLRDSLGWALGVELGFESMFQEQITAQDQPLLTYLLTYNGQVFALAHRAPDQGDWVVAADNR